MPSEKKPRVLIPTNFDQLMTVSESVMTITSGAELGELGQTQTSNVALDVLYVNLTTAKLAAQNAHVAKIAAETLAKIKTSERNAQVEIVVGLLRDIRDMAFVEFQADYALVGSWGFTVIAAPAPTPPPEPEA